MSNWFNPNIEILIGGDYNCTLDSELDRKNCVGENDVGQVDLKVMIDNCDLEDIWRRRNPDRREYSWNCGDKYSRLDYWLVNVSLDNQIDEVYHKKCPFSDHSSVNLKFRITETDYGKGVWKMNASVLQSKLFQDSFRVMWRDWKKVEDLYNDKRVWWDIGKKANKEIGNLVFKKDQ